MKRLEWVGSTRQRLRCFPKEARCKAGDELYLIQRGANPHDCKPMPAIGPGALEIRIHQPHEYRVVYVVMYSDVVYVIHAFEKKTQRTPLKDIRIAKTNYAEIQKKERERAKDKK